MRYGSVSRPVYPSPGSPQTLTSGHENCIVTVGCAAVQRRIRHVAGAPRAMHKTPCHAHPEQLQAAGAVLPPREIDWASLHAHARCPRCYRAQVRLHCRTGPRAHMRRDDPPAEAVRLPARPRFFPFPQCVNVERFATAARSSRWDGSNMCCTRDSELSAVRVFDARAAAAAVAALSR